MPVSIPYVFTNGTVAEAAEVNSNFTAVKNFADGLATGVNLDDGAVVAAKIGTNAVTTAKINDGAVTQAKLAPGVGVSGDSDQVVLGGQVFG
jgi:trimeric autotransporter adhesin